MPENSSNWTNKGFTLVEIIIVVTILGILAAVALPHYVGQTERFTAGEGVQTLSALLLSQKRYALENSGNYTSQLTDLDLTIPASPHFDPPAVANDAAAVASIARNTGAYTLSISETGAISCSGAICTSIKTWK